mmetsp:Transcript_19345/g.38654  ORF Transcript_19345/g.38654 Transcript_19345/m.38654 type:complete len:181 (-) Transcript_19345:31-573(-)
MDTTGYTTLASGNPSHQQSDLSSSVRPFVFCSNRLELVSPRQFVLKNLFIFAATYAFIPIIGEHDEGKIAGLTYALILIGLHVLFIVVYFWKVNFGQLDPDKNTLCARVVGLIFCLLLLMLVAGNLSDGDLSLLAIELLGLYAVHSLILALLSIRVRDNVAEDGTHWKPARAPPPALASV